MEYSLLELLTIKHEKTERGIKETKEEVGFSLFIYLIFINFYLMYICVCVTSLMCVPICCAMCMHLCVSNLQRSENHLQDNSVFSFLQVLLVGIF